MSNRQPVIGDVVSCWGVGFDKNGETGVILEIDPSKKYPYRIKSQRPTKGNGIWCSRHEFGFIDPSIPPSVHYTDISQLAQWRKENK